MTTEIVDKVAPMDNFDVEQLQNSRESGKYEINVQGILHGTYDNGCVTIVGRFSRSKKNDIIIHFMNKVFDMEWADYFEFIE